MDNDNASITRRSSASRRSSLTGRRNSRALRDPIAQRIVAARALGWLSGRWPESTPPPRDYDQRFWLAREIVVHTCAALAKVVTVWFVVHVLVSRVP